MAGSRIGAMAARSGAAALAPLENLTLWERVHRHLREEILANRLPPGTMLGEVALSAQLGVSRGPIREALGRLAAEGLVTVRPRRGAVVSALTAAEFLEAYQVREALETQAIRLAIPRLSPEEIGRLEEMVAAQGAQAAHGDVAGFFASNAAFHQLFVDASGNRTLAEMYRQLMGHMGRYRMRSLALRGTLKRSVTEHRAILRAVKARDAERAARLLRDHIRVPQRRLETASDGEVVLTR
jgi:DNA-binding GntR family transcriptional regulator